MTVYAYTRVSTAEQIEGTSLTDQAERITAQARALGLPTPAVVVDAGVSGSVPLADRPAGSEMLDRLARGDTIIALKLDRLFRSARDALNVAEELKQRGVQLILLDLSTEPVNGSSGMGQLVFTIMAAVAEMERTRIADRVSAGRAAKKAAGGAIGPAPFGYRKVGVGKAAKLEPDPEQQAALHTIHKTYGSGMTLRDVSALVSSMHPGVKVSHVTVGRILNDLAEQHAAEALAREELL